MRMDASGLLSKFWERSIVTTSGRRCLDKAKEMLQVPVQARLSLSHLSGAFVVLAVGLILSLMSFIGELAQRCCNR